MHHTSLKMKEKKRHAKRKHTCRFRYPDRRRRASRGEREKRDRRDGPGCRSKGRLPECIDRITWLPNVTVSALPCRPAILPDAAAAAGGGVGLSWVDQCKVSDPRLLMGFSNTSTVCLARSLSTFCLQHMMVVFSVGVCPVAAFAVFFA